MVYFVLAIVASALFTPLLIILSSLGLAEEAATPQALHYYYGSPYSGFAGDGKMLDKVCLSIALSSASPSSATTGHGWLRSLEEQGPERGSLEAAAVLAAAGA